MTTTLTTLALITFGLTEAIFLFAIVVLLFGAKKLPMLARGLGHGIRNFKGELQAPPDEPEPDDLD